jgi:isocitrate/isopropylmalate dehydrogenase
MFSPSTGPIQLAVRATPSALGVSSGAGCHLACGFSAKAAQKRRKKVTNVDKANVLETSQFWRDTAIKVSAEYPDIELSHLYIDNSAAQLVRAPVSQVSGKVEAAAV